MFSDIYIFFKNLKLQLFSKFWILWQNFGKIQSFGSKFSQNFLWNIDKIFDTAGPPHYIEY